MSQQIQIVHQQIFADGSGSTGLYSVYGWRVAATRNHEGVITARPLVSPSSNLTRRQKEIIKSARAKVEAHVAGLACPAWAGETAAVRQ